MLQRLRVGTSNDKAADSNFQLLGSLLYNVSPYNLNLPTPYGYLDDLNQNNSTFIIHTGSTAAFSFTGFSTNSPASVFVYFASGHGVTLVDGSNRSTFPLKTFIGNIVYAQHCLAHFLFSGSVWLLVTSNGEIP